MPHTPKRTPPGKPKKEKAKGEYRNLMIVNGIYTFEVKRKDNTWTALGGLSGETSKADAEKFAQNTAESWRKR